MPFFVTLGHLMANQAGFNRAAGFYNGQVEDQLPQPARTKGEFMDVGAAIEAIRPVVSHFGLELDDQTRADLKLFCRLLLAYSRHTNLVSRDDAEWLVNEHLLDSLTVAAQVKQLQEAWSADKHERERKSLVDIGSGGGFPGAVIAIVLPDFRVTCVDSVGKKTKFLSDVAAQLGMGERLVAVNGRAEELAHDAAYRGKFGFGTARAVAALSVVVELVVPFLLRGGVFLAQKSANQFEDELSAAGHIMSETGSRLARVIKLDPQKVGGSARLIAVIEKNDTTPERYPRAWTAIMKKASGGASR